MKVISRPPQLDGFPRSQLDNAILGWLAQWAGDGNFVDIGCGRGESTLAVLEKRPISRAFAVDWSENHRLSGPAAREVPNRSEIAKLAKAKFPEIEVRDEDAFAIAIGELEPIAICHIDADRTAAGCQKISNRISKAMQQSAVPGSFLAWGSYGGEHSAVKWYLDGLPYPNLYHVHGSRTAFCTYFPSQEFKQLIDYLRGR